MQPYQRVSTWAPAYESDYRNGIPIGTAAPENVGWALPMLFHSNDEWVLITEAGLDRTSYGVHIERRARRRPVSRAAPRGGRDVRRRAAGGGDRLPVVVALARASSSGPTLGDDRRVDRGDRSRAARRRTTDVAWIKPGRASWSWWSDTTSPRDYQKLFPFVDLASRLRWEYSLLDAAAGRRWRTAAT